MEQKKQNHQSLRFENALFTFSENETDLKQALDEFRLVARDTLDDHCICGQKILHRFHCQNSVNFVEIIVGSCCIEKFGQGSELHDEIKKSKWPKKHVAKCLTYSLR